jgi:hypothetical protein
LASSSQSASRGQSSGSSEKSKKEKSGFDWASLVECVGNAVGGLLSGIGRRGGGGRNIEKSRRQISRDFRVRTLDGDGDGGKPIEFALLLRIIEEKFVYVCGGGGRGRERYGRETFCQNDYRSVITWSPYRILPIMA